MEFKNIGLLSLIFCLLTLETALAKPDAARWQGTGTLSIKESSSLPNGERDCSVLASVEPKSAGPSSFVLIFQLSFSCGDMGEFTYSRRYERKGTELWTFVDPMTTKTVYAGLAHESYWDLFHYGDDRLRHLGPATFDGDSAIRWDFESVEVSRLHLDFQNLPPFSDHLTFTANLKSQR